MDIGAFSAKGVQSRDVGKTHWLPVLVPVSLIAVSLGLWLVSLRQIDLQRMTDLGLISVLPPATFVALALLVVSYGLTLRQRPLQTFLLALHLVVLILILYGTKTPIDEVPRFGSAWRHVGVTEYIMRTGTVDPTIDAYFNWPGFFILSAFVVQIAGFSSAVSLLPWAPVFFNLLYLGPLVMILRVATRDNRLVWLGAWLFYITNWIGQDYFSPQAFNYFLFLVIVAILLTWFKTTTEGSESVKPGRFGLARLAGYLGHWRMLSRLMGSVSDWLQSKDLANVPGSPRQRMGLAAIVVSLAIVSASSHQLTPFFLLTTITVLVVLRRCSLPGLPVLIGVITFAWISYMAVAYIAGHADQITGGIGHVNNAVRANLTNRIQGSLEHRLIIYIRLALTLVVWGLAVLGGWRRLRAGYRDLTYVALALSLFPFLGVQSYGGELLLRVYLFTLPFVLLFVAALFYPAPALGTSWRMTAAIGATSLILLAGFWLIRYGNERMDTFTSREVDAVLYLYNTARPGSLLVTSSFNLPWKFQDVEKYEYVQVSDRIVAADVNGVARIMANRRYPQSYLVLTRSQEAHLELFDGLQPEQWNFFVNGLVNSGKFSMVYANNDAMILTLTDAGRRGSP